MTPSQFRKIVLSIPDVVESEHMSHPDFRIGGKVIASLGAPEKDWGMIKLPPGIQESYCQSNPDCFQPCKGAWGNQGYTNIRLASATTATVRSALQLAVENVVSLGVAKQPGARKSASNEPKPKKTL